MAFTPQLMPQPKMVHGVNKQIVDPVFVTGNGVRETRRKQNRYARSVWTYPSNSILEESKWELYKFFTSIDSGLTSFLFIDPEMPYLDRMPLRTLPGETNNWIVQPNGFYTPQYQDSKWYWFPALKAAPYFFVTHSSYYPVEGAQDWKVEITRDNGLTWSDETSNAAFYLGNDNVMHLSLDNSWGHNYQVVVSGANVRVGRLNSQLNWTIGAMQLGPDGKLAPIAVEMGDLQIVEVFEGFF